MPVWQRLPGGDAEAGGETALGCWRCRSLLLEQPVAEAAADLYKCGGTQRDKSKKTRTSKRLLLSFLAVQKNVHGINIKLTS